MSEPLVSRRRVGVGIFVAVSAFAAYQLFGASDQRRILKLLGELAASVSSLPGDTDLGRARRVRAALARSTLPDVTLSVPELGAFEGREAIAALFELADGVRLRLSIEQSDVRVKGARAEATLLTALVVNLPGEERRQVRTLSVELTRADDGFRVRSISVSARSSEQPEPRP